MSFSEKLSRREVLRATASLAVASGIGYSLGAGSAPKAAPKPNIIFILADDLGFADLSCYGRMEYQTPRIDSLARDGIRFTQAYANSAVCSATRTAIMTGRYQNRLAVGLEEPLGGDKIGLPPTHPTLPSLLKGAGYQTALIGKWHLGRLPLFGPLKSGSDQFFGISEGASDYFKHDEDLWNGERHVNEAGYLTDLFGDHAISTVSSFAVTKRPFFLSLHFNAPHWPWEGPDDQAESRRLASKSDPWAIADYDGGSMATFAAMVTRMDFQVGRLLDHLNEIGIADDTLVIFTSDNGGERYSNTWPFAGKKTELLEGGLRIPTIVRWKDQIPAGRTSNQVMMSMDWLPTLLEMSGAAPNPAYPPDGKSLVDVLLHDAPVSRRELFWRYLNMNQEACRAGDFKYLKILENTFLFNVVDDPLERSNLKDRNAAVYADLRGKFQKWNSQMLPLNYGAYTEGETGKNMADHFGISSDRTVLRD